MVNNFELTVPEPERQYWVELYPSWEETIIHVNGFEGGVLMGLIMHANEKAHRALYDVWKQLVAIKKVVEEEAGVTKGESNGREDSAGKS
ncbi:hypothetical protein ES703_92237 [subsurface metagenome]